MFLNIFFEMVRWWLHLKVEIRSSSSYPRSGGVSSASGWRVELCVRWISWNLVSFHVRWYGFMLVSFDIWLVDDGCCAGAQVFKTLARWLFVYLVQKTLPRQALPGTGDEETTTTRLRLMLVHVVVARCSKFIFIIKIIFMLIYITVDDY
jgi:hypothetical protein